MAAAKGNKNVVVNKGGRPVIYDEAYIARETADLLEWLKDFHKNPDKIYLGDWSAEKPYDEHRIHEWCKVNPAFSSAIAQCKRMQEKKFLKMGLEKKWAEGFTMFAMARLCADKWKKSYDTPSESAEQHIGTVTINKIYKNKA